MKVRDLIKLVEQDGWRYIESHGSHRQFKHPIETGWFEMKYAVIYEKGPTSYGAYVPDLPGCIAVAETIQEVQQLIKEAIELHLKAMREDGDPIPEPTSIADNVVVLAGD